MSQAIVMSLLRVSVILLTNVYQYDILTLLLNVHQADILISMSKQQTNIRLSADTRRQIAQLAVWWGVKKPEAVARAIDRIYQEEINTRKEEEPKK